MTTFLYVHHINSFTQYVKLLYINITNVLFKYIAMYYLNKQALRKRFWSAGPQQLTLSLRPAASAASLQDLVGLKLFLPAWLSGTLTHADPQAGLRRNTSGLLGRGEAFPSASADAGTGGQRSPCSLCWAMHWERIAESKLGLAAREPLEAHIRTTFLEIQREVCRNFSGDDRETCPLPADTQA